MGLINQDNRTKQDLTNTRTPEDVMRRLAKNVQITTDEVKGLTVEVKGKVDGKEIISTINQSAEAVTIDASKININGTLSANGNFKVDTSGDMTCNNATITNATINTATINNATINTINNTNNPSIALRSTNDNTYYRGTYIRPSNMELLNFMQSGGEESIEPSIQLTWTFADLSTFLGAGGLSTNGEVSSVHGICQGSKEELKKNFEKLDDALDIVKDVDIYKYNLKKENDTDKKHVGFVIGDNFKYRKEITSQKNDGVDLYSMVSVLWKAVQEQQLEIEELKKVIK